MLKEIILAMTLVIAVGCSGEPDKPEASQAPGTGAHETALTPNTAENHLITNYNLMFFLDPNGRPCQMQDAILSGLSEELRGKVNIRHVKTTVPADRNLFYQYGIRALPALLLADASGNEIKRIPPGVKNETDIRSLVHNIPGY